MREAWAAPLIGSADLDIHGVVASTRGVDEKHFLDDQTWQDLNLYVVFAHLDRTCSLPGEIELYRILRSPLTDAALLEGGDRLITLFQTDADARERVQLELSELGRTRYAYGLVELLWGGLPPRSGWSPLYRLLAVVVAACVLITVGLAAAGCLGPPLRWDGLRSFFPSICSFTTGRGSD